jgi:hypothetical protein
MGNFVIEPRSDESRRAWFSAALVRIATAG